MGDEEVTQLDVFDTLVAIVGSIKALPTSREASLAITKLQEAVFWLEEAASNLTEDFVHRTRI